jgi:hypothetical protein
MANRERQSPPAGTIGRRNHPGDKERVRDETSAKASRNKDFVHRRRRIARDRYLFNAERAPQSAVRK